MHAQPITAIRAASDCMGTPMIEFDILMAMMVTKTLTLTSNDLDLYIKSRSQSYL